MICKFLWISFLNDEIEKNVTSKMPNHNCGYACSNIETDRKIGSYLLV